jgi:hypothetical protein
MFGIFHPLLRDRVMASRECYLDDLSGLTELGEHCTVLEVPGSPRSAKLRMIRRRNSFLSNRKLGRCNWAIH